MHSQPNLLVRQFSLDTSADLVPRYNIAPTQQVSVVRLRADASRELSLLRWGLVPSWAQDPSIGQRMINARAETIASKPSYRAAFRRRRCLVPADGYYEWQKVGRAKQPYYIRLRDEPLFALAGLWEQWHDTGGELWETFAIITTEANQATRTIHDRMPVILSPQDYAQWLDAVCEQSAALEVLQNLLRPYTGPMQLDPVTTFVNNPRNDSPQCIVK